VSGGGGLRRRPERVCFTIPESSRRTVAALETVQRGEDLSIVGDKSLANERGAVHQQLENAQGPCHHRGVLGVESLCEIGSARMHVRGWRQADWCDLDSQLSSAARENMPRTHA
jgi:hypothetical protein